MATTTTNTPATALCGGHVSSRRGLLASLWTLVTLLTAISFVVALIFTLSAHDASGDDDADNNNNNQNNNNDQTELAITNRAMAFCALWTAVLATLLAIFGTVILGWQSPTGQYYTCCAAQVHRTTPLALGSFIGALIMFANLTLVCSVLFGEFEVSCKKRKGTWRRRRDEIIHSPHLIFTKLSSILFRFATTNAKEAAILTAKMPIRPCIALVWHLVSCAWY